MEKSYSWLPEFGPYGVWEYSAFNPAIWLCIGAGLLLGFKAFRKRDTQTGDRLWILFAAALGLIGLSCLCESESPLSLHHWINELLLDGSAAVTGRYEAVLSLACTILAALLIKRLPRWTVIPLLVLLNLNFLSFYPVVSLASFERVYKFSSKASSEMNKVAIAPATEEGESQMYEATLQGWAVLNCYNSITRDIRMTGRFEGRRELMDPQTGKLRERMIYPLIDTSKAVPEACVAESYFTQNHLAISPQCPPGTCLNLNGLNPADASQVKIDPQSGKYCL
jgi:hypothetical protein